MDLMDLALEFRDYEWCKRIARLYEDYEKEEKEKDVKKQEDLKEEKEEVPTIVNNVATIDKFEKSNNEIEGIDIVEVKKKIYKGVISENLEQYLAMRNMIKHLSLKEKIAYIVYTSQGNTNKEDAEILIEVLESMGN